ncbi:GntR family transcriptional regulator [Desnuesiella massiliensis]|uniref:GntR family transcriptional regulator n=1 Tax=Desnuesiella massiliensis TaxID=1650662 RepID=UPI0006E24B07|nr:GntR family transcriptional regulator [Desnuesiella massiliensis]
MNIEFNDKTPIYIQIMDLIKSDIVSGKIKIGDKLPSVRELATMLKVNPNTLQRTYQELEREGIVYTQRGMGTFVKEEKGIMANLKKEMAKQIIEEFMYKMKNLGFNSKEIANVISEEALKEESING